MTDSLPTTPYLIRAIYEWCCDGGQSPYIAVKVNENTRVPLEYVKDGRFAARLCSGGKGGLQEARGAQALGSARRERFAAPGT